MGKLVCPTKGGNRGVSLQAQKFELFPYVGYHKKIEPPYPSPDYRPDIAKKDISNCS